MSKTRRAARLLLTAAALLGLPGLGGLGVQKLASEELPTPAEERALADNIFRNMTPHGFAEPESVQLEGCRLVITTHFTRRCEGEPDNHSFVREVRDVDLRELSYMSDDFGTTASASGISRVWLRLRDSVAAKVSQIEEARQAVISAEPPGIPPDDSANLERPMAISKMTERMIEEFDLNSRQTLHTCSGQARVFPLAGGLPIEVVPGNEEGLIADLVSYGSQYCSQPLVTQIKFLRN